MADVFLHHRIRAAPRAWAAVSDGIRIEAGTIEPDGGRLYGIWRSQIGRPRDELTVITAWPEAVAATAAARMNGLLGNLADVRRHSTIALRPTLRPATSEPPRRQGNYAFRWFTTPESHWDEFLSLCADAWPGFEAAYDSQVIGLWRAIEPGATAIRSLLVTRRPDLAMWERSKLPQGAGETRVRETLSRRYDLCDDTVVFTTTLLTADDRADTARWA